MLLPSQFCLFNGCDKAFSGNGYLFVSLNLYSQFRYVVCHMVCKISNWVKYNYDPKPRLKIIFYFFTPLVAFSGLYIGCPNFLYADYE